MKFLTEDQKTKIKECYSGLKANHFLELKIKQQNVYMDKLDDVVNNIIFESPDLFQGSVVKQTMLRRR